MHIYYWSFVCSELTQIIGDVIADPTLPRTDDHPCPRCQHKESVFFQSHSTRAEVNTVWLMELFVFIFVGIHYMCIPDFLLFWGYLNVGILNVCQKCKKKCNLEILHSTRFTKSKYVCQILAHFQVILSKVIFFTNYMYHLNAWYTWWWQISINHYSHENTWNI